MIILPLATTLMFLVPHIQHMRAAFLLRDGLKIYLEQASVFVIQPNGNVYAAWVQPDDSVIHYISNTANRNDMQTDIN